MNFNLLICLYFMIVILLIIIKYYKQIQNIENLIIYNTNIDNDNIGCTPTTDNHGGANRHNHGCCPIGQGKNADGICDNCPSNFFSDDYSINCKECDGGEVFPENGINFSGCRCGNNRQKINGGLCVWCNTNYDVHLQNGSYHCKETNTAFDRRKATDIDRALKLCKIWDTKLETERTVVHGNHHRYDDVHNKLTAWGHSDFNDEETAKWTNDMRDDKKISNGGGKIEGKDATCRFTFYDDKNFDYLNTNTETVTTSSSDWYEVVSNQDKHSSVMVTIVTPPSTDWTQKIESMHNSVACPNCTE